MTPLYQKKLRRKNFLPALIVTIFLWLSLGGIIYFIDPDVWGVKIIFFVLCFLACLFTFSTIFANTRRGTLTALGLTVFLILRYFGIGNILNFLLIAGILVATEIYFCYSSAK